MLCICTLFLYFILKYEWSFSEQNHPFTISTISQTSVIPNGQPSIQFLPIEFKLTKPDL